MLPIQPLRSFLPIDNPLGFGPADFLELGIAALLVFFAIASRGWIEPYARRLAPRTAWCMLLLAALPIVLRLALLPNHPVPTPDVYDEFGHLLVADTLRHFRFANPPHALSQFFETFFVLQHPTYSSIYPIGQGIALAIGWTFFGLPWAGVVLSTAAFCALTYWMLRAWTTPVWSLIGGIFAVIEFGPLNQWMNDYWGGSLTAVAGCLVFGALPRLKAAPRERDAVLLGLGLAIHLLTRPYESIFLFVAVAIYFLPGWPRMRQPPAEKLGKIRPQAGVADETVCPTAENTVVVSVAQAVSPAISDYFTASDACGSDQTVVTRHVGVFKVAPTVLLLVAAALGLTLLQNRQVTGSFTTLPYQLSQYQYGVPAPLTFQPNPVPHAELTPEQEMDYRMQQGFRGNSTDTLSTYLLRLEYRFRFYRFFYLAPLYLVLPLFFLTLRRYSYLWVLLTLILFTLGINFFPAYQLHYAAACTCLYLLVAIAGLQRLKRSAARILIFLCAGHFLFWYSLHMFEHSSISQAMLPYETWDAINHQTPQRRILVAKQLEQIPGQLLVFVTYTYPPHAFQEEWVYNHADIDASRIVWARDLGRDENRKLLDYYPNRKALLLAPDARPVQLTEYPRP